MSDGTKQHWSFGGNVDLEWFLLDIGDDLIGPFDSRQEAVDFDNENKAILLYREVGPLKRWTGPR